MGRARLIAVLVGVAALLALLAPSSALAGTFSWSLPGDFTTTAPGSNPEMKYGAPSWSYTATGTMTFSSSLDGGSGWTDGSGDNVADTGGHIELDAAAMHSARITWTNPFNATQSVTVTSRFSTALCVGGGVSQPSNGTHTLAPGATLTVKLTGGTLTPCQATGSISISATTPGPMVTLHSPGSTPLHTATPALSGTASTRFGDSNQVTVKVYSGTNTSSTPVRHLTATVGANGGFAVQVTPALADGQYTAVASQASSTDTGFSPAVPFRIKVFPPALALFRPPDNVWIGRATLAFSGRAGDDLGDRRTVDLLLHRGKSTGGRLVGKRRVSRHGGSWSMTWPGLSLGYYTVVAVQRDDAGHTTRTSPHTFKLVSRIRAFGSRVTVTRTGLASIPIGCLAPSARSCRGTVLVVTQRSFRTSAGGPLGPLEVLFSSVRIPGGTMGVISAKVPGRVMAVLRRLRRVEVRVTAKFSNSGGHRSVTRSLRIT